MRYSIVIPFHRSLTHLEACLAALRSRPADGEVIVVADGAVDAGAPLAAKAGARWVPVSPAGGPARARNRGAALATGQVLVFVDADVVVEPGTLDRLLDLFASRPDVDAAFGAYDERPPEQNLISQYKNLAHSYIHQSSGSDASTFWAGFGAVRASVFRAVGGFDERYRRTSVEDIDLGYRLTAAGHRVRLDAALRVTHLKRWTFGSLVRTDIRDRGIPWTQLIHRSGRAHDDLNIRSRYRVSVVLAYLVPVFMALSLASPAALAGACASLLLLIALGHRFYRFLLGARGPWFTLKILPVHYLYHLYNGLSFATGTALYLVQRYTGVRLPGALPLDPWPAGAWSLLNRVEEDEALLAVTSSRSDGR